MQPAAEGWRRLAAATSLRMPFGELGGSSSQLQGALLFMGVAPESWLSLYMCG